MRRSCTSSASTGRSAVQYPDYLGNVAARRFRHLARHQAPGPAANSSRCSRRRSSCRSAPCSSPWSLGVPAGVFAAVRRGSVLDQTVMGAALIGYSMPIFWWGLLLIILFSGMLRWTPVSGRISLAYFFPPVTGFMLIDCAAVRPAGRLRLGAQPSDPALDRARHHPARRHRAADPLGDAGGAGRGLRAHRARQGPVAVPRRRRCTRCATR